MGHSRFARAEVLVSGVLVALEVASCLPDTPKRLSPEGGVSGADAGVAAGGAVSGGAGSESGGIGGDGAGGVRGDGGRSAGGTRAAGGTTGGVGGSGALGDGGGAAAGGGGAGGARNPSCHPNCAVGAVCVSDANCVSAQCKSGICHPACSASGCDVGQPCLSISDCNSSLCSGGVCNPTCGSTCTPGASCANDSNCVGPDTCDQPTHTCVTVCGDLTFDDQASLDAARYCKSATSVTFGGTLQQVTPSDLPYLVDIGTDFTANASPSLVHLTMSALRTVGRSLVIAQTMGWIDASFPALVQIGSPTVLGGLTVGLSDIQRVSAPALTTIFGIVSIGNAVGLTELDLRGLNKVTSTFGISYAHLLVNLNLSALTSHANIAGAVNISELWKIPWSQIQPISHPAGTNDTFSEIGCCLASELSCTAGGYTCN